MAGEFEVGFNVPGITHYPHEDVLPSARAEDVRGVLDEMRAMGATLVRVFVAYNTLSDEEAANRLDAFLTVAEDEYPEIRVIPCLSDYYRLRWHRDNVPTGCYPQGTEHFYTLEEREYGEDEPSDEEQVRQRFLNHEFFAGGYKTRYLPFVEHVVAHNRHHQNIYAWQPGNELSDGRHPEPQAFLDFMVAITAKIKQLGGNVPIVTGFIKAGHAHPSLTPDALYTRLPADTIVTIHDYNGKREGAEDIVWARDHERTALVEEIGIEHGDRAAALREELRHWRDDAQASGALHWTFIPSSCRWDPSTARDNGDGDQGCGVDIIWHNQDYDDMCRVLREAVR
jgi:hypothetical protein